MISIPDALWSQLLDEFARVDPAVERVAYLDGYRIGDDGVVTTVTIPDADLHPGYYDVSAAAMSQAGQHFRTYEMARLAQVHTHGGAGCHHSWRDDEAAYSQRSGSVSIVLPYHAARRPQPHEGIVHLREADGWTRLDVPQAASTVRLIPALLDFRSPKWIQSQTDTQAPSTGAWSRWMNRIALRFRSRSRQG